MKIYVYSLRVPDTEDDVFTENVMEADDFVKTENGWKSESLGVELSSELKSGIDETTFDLLLELASEEPIEDAGTKMLELFEEQESENDDCDPMGCAGCGGDPSCPAFCSDCLV